MPPSLYRVHPPRPIKLDMLLPIYQYFNYTLNYLALNSYDFTDDIDLTSGKIRYGLGVYVIISGKDILIKQFSLEHYELNVNWDDIIIKFPNASERQGYIRDLEKKQLDEKYIDIAKKYIDIKAEEHVRAELKIAKELGIDYTPFYK